MLSFSFLRTLSISGSFPSRMDVAHPGPQRCSLVRSCRIVGAGKGFDGGFQRIGDSWRKKKGPPAWPRHLGVRRLLGAGPMRSRQRAAYAFPFLKFTTRSAIVAHPRCSASQARIGRPVAQSSSSRRTCREKAVGQGALMQARHVPGTQFRACP
jgi:hypothetical protein